VRHCFCFFAFTCHLNEFAYGELCVITCVWVGLYSALVVLLVFPKVAYALRLSTHVT
jgi:hypothetical protein